MDRETLPLVAAAFAALLFIPGILGFASAHMDLGHSYTEDTTVVVTADQRAEING